MKNKIKSLKLDVFTYKAIIFFFVIVLIVMCILANSQTQKERQLNSKILELEYSCDSLTALNKSLTYNLRHLTEWNELTTDNQRKDFIKKDRLQRIMLLKANE